MDEETQELEDGLYSMRLYSSTTASWKDYCVDVSGANDRSGTNLNVWSWYGGGGQIMWVEKKDDGYVLGYPLTGNVVTVDGEVSSMISVDDGDGNSHEEPNTPNIIQWEFNDTEQQYWNLVDSGEVGVVDGVTYTVWYVENASNNDMTITVEGARHYANVYLSDKASAGNRRKFMFVPMATLPDGTYKITPYLNGNGCIGIAGNSKANKASAVLVALNDGDALTNFQTFKVENLPSGRCRIVCVANGNCFDVDKGSEKDGAYLIVYPWKGTVNQEWLLRYCTTKKRYGIETPIFNIICRLGAYHKAVDIEPPKNGKVAAAPGTNVYTYHLENKNHTSQWYWFTACEAYANNLTVPSDLLGCVNGEYGTVLGVTGTSDIYPSWIGSGEEWKIRYRYKSRFRNQTNNAMAMEWTDWRSLDHDYKSNDGWGEPGLLTTTASLGDNRRYTSDIPKTVSFGYGSTSRDRLDIQFQVRQLTHEWGNLLIDAHSGSCTGTITVALKATLTINSVAINNKGAVITYTSNFPRSSNTIHIWVDKMFDYSKSGLASSGTVTASGLKQIPEGTNEGTVELVVKWEITTCDGVFNSGSSLVNATIDFASAASFTPQENFIASNHTLRIICPNTLSQIRCWLLFDSEDRGTNIEYTDAIEIDSRGRTFYIPYPLTKAFKVLVVGITNNVMYKFEQSYVNRNEVTRLWNFDDSSGMNHDHCIGTWAIDSPPEETVDTTASNDDRPTTSGNWNKVKIGKVRSQSRSVTAVSMDNMDSSGRDRIKRLSAARYAWYRNPEGEVCRVAIISVNETRKYYGSEFSVEMRRIDEHT